ncbi:MAG: FAD-binding oxidoreductase [Candidatus Hodarchaeales archaeon]
MRRFDTLIQIIIGLMIIDLSSIIILLIDRPQKSIEYLFIVTIIILNDIGLIALIVYAYLMKKERKIIESKISEFAEEGMRVYTKKYEKLMYSRDVVDLPRLARLFFDMNTVAIVQPKNPEELKKVLQLCNRHKIPVIPRASGTSGYGGTLPVKNGVIVNLNYFDKIINFDEDKMVVEVETNVIWKRLMQFLDSKGYTLRNYPSSSPSSAVGGWVSQGGYGIGSSYYGSIDNSVVELSVIGLNGEYYTVKIPECYVGSCGTLGIIWKISLKIEKKRPLKHMAFLGSNKEKILESIVEFQKLKAYNIRFIDRQNLGNLISLTDQKGHHFDKISRENEGILSISFFKDGFNEKAINNLVEQYSLVIQSEEIAEAFWEERFSTLKIKRKGPSLITSEVVIPIKKVKEFYKVLEKRFDEKNYATELLATVDSNAVIMVLFPVDLRRKRLPMIGSMSYAFRLIRSFDIIQIARKLEGRSYSTGLWFSSYLKEVISNDCLLEMKQIKKEKDPLNLLNPGKVFSMWVPRFFPLVKMSFIIRVTIPIITGLYTIIPKKYR